MISANVFSFLDITTTMLGRRMHMLCTSWGFILISAHIGLHLNSMIMKIKEKLNNSTFCNIGEGLSIHYSGGSSLSSDIDKWIEKNNIGKNEENHTKASRIKLTVNSEEIYVNLENNKSVQDFISMLPLTLNVEDYNSTEKIATLPRKLTTEGSPDGYTPQVGDFAYYAPWGNLSMFYNNFRYSDSLIKLGTFEEGGIDKIKNIDSEFTIKIEKVN